MDPRVEEILMAKIVADNAAQPTMSQAGTLGAAAGGALGVLGGRGFKGKMAGGLMNALMGGAAGMGIRNAMIQEVPEARLLAKIQSQGEVTDADKAVIQNMLTEAYSKMGL
jgi:outer membrane lipoprotein SlyB